MVYLSVPPHNFVGKLTLNIAYHVLKCCTIFMTMYDKCMNVCMAYCDTLEIDLRYSAGFFLGDAFEQHFSKMIHTNAMLKTRE